MKKIVFIMFLSLFFGCFKNKNPFFETWQTPFETPPFNLIKTTHFMPAYKEGVIRQQKEIQTVVDNAEAPTFANTVEALDRSGELLKKVDHVFNNLNNALTGDEMQKIAKEAAPLISRNKDDIRLNTELFKQIKNVYEARSNLDLSNEQLRLVEEYYKDFIRSGANLNDEQKAELRRINEELSVLSIQFGENVLKENNVFEMVIDDEGDLAGLPEAAIIGAEETAQERGYEGKWVFTLHHPSMIPFLQYSEKRELREKIFKGYINRGSNGNELDNKGILSRMAALRVKKVNLLGYPTHAHYILEKNMAKTPENVYDLLYKLWKPALKRAKSEARALQKMIDREGYAFKLQPWDWWYCAEKLKKEKYDLDEEMVRPYLKLENVRNGAFAVANKLWGLQFVQRDDIPKYHEDVVVFEVLDGDGSHLGILFTDYFPRASKRGGAWMDAYRKQIKLKGERIAPVICNVGNFSKPAGDKPALLSWDEVMTLFHELGHGLHGLLSNCTYYKLSGTSVARDFVELPSQIMENWASEPEVLKMYARHYETGEPMPDKLIQKIKKAGHFNQGFATVEYLAASFLDMDWHTLKDTVERDPLVFEKASLDKIGLIPEIVVRYRSPYFRHIFAGGYSSGYYSYIWSEVLDSDAFKAFKETDIFDKKTAAAFRENILSKGGTEDAMTLYKRFRGREPKIEPILKKRGLK